jgi:Terminase large subunit, T4likevirus-type, N-terminal
MVDIADFIQLGAFGDDDKGIQGFNRLVFGSELHDGQLRISLEARKLFNLISPGNSFGKTEHIAREAVRWCWYKLQKDHAYASAGDFLRKDYRALVASYQFDIAKESYKRLEHLYEQGGVFSQMVSRIIRTDPPRIEFINGATLDFGSLDQGGRHVEATRRQVIFVDEVGHMADFKSIYGNVLRPRGIGVGGIVIAYGTPKDVTDPWLYEVAVEAEGFHPSYYFYEASSFENTYWPAGEKEQVLRDPLLVRPNGELTPLGQQVIHGKFIIAGGLWFPRINVMRAFRGTHTWQNTKGRHSMTAWDTGGSKKGGDATVGVTLDLSEVPWRVTRLEHVPAGSASWGERYDLIEQCYWEDEPQLVGVDVTGNNDSIQEELEKRNIPVEPLHFGGNQGMKKLDMLRNIQALFDMDWQREVGLLDNGDIKYEEGSGYIRFPDEREHPELEDRRKEFERYKLEDRKLTTDTVMATAMAAKLATDLYVPDPVFGAVY